MTNPPTRTGVLFDRRRMLVAEPGPYATVTRAVDSIEDLATALQRGTEPREVDGQARHTNANTEALRGATMLLGFATSGGAGSNIADVTLADLLADLLAALMFASAAVGTDFEEAFFRGLRYYDQDEHGDS
ncbi:hypothetical protein [Nocardia sp. NPDC052566]|uniref:hypothetical protein n=1 Tax=Nocardia sp. NPDC052566 TaxID=3364330 RepID=UPI0037C79CFC